MTSSSVPIPKPMSASQLLVCLTMKPKFWPKNPVNQLSGKKTVAMIVSCFITELSRFETVDK